MKSIAYITMFESDMNYIFSSFKGKYDWKKTLPKNKPSEATDADLIIVNGSVENAKKDENLLYLDHAFNYAKQFPSKPVGLILSQSQKFAENYSGILSQMKNIANLFIYSDQEITSMEKELFKFEPEVKKQIPKKILRNMPDIFIGSIN